ncbi:hypothetical protein M2S00_00160 [Apilactobacillus sp. TMW 2.2459]|nr:hypothetical protein [Apilactobacillus xinyiensis]MCL0311530.1 hypothetical protein [Apilactobacillus xinyiensis]
MYKTKRIITLAIILGLVFLFQLSSLNNKYVKVKQGPAYNSQTEYVWK